MLLREGLLLAVRLRDGSSAIGKLSKTTGLWEVMIRDSGRVVGKQEVKQSARVRADYYISCAFGLRSVGFVREGSPRCLRALLGPQAPGPKYIDFKLRGGRNEEILRVPVQFVCSVRYRLGARKIKRPVEVR